MHSNIGRKMPSRLSSSKRVISESRNMRGSISCANFSMKSAICCSLSSRGQMCQWYDEQATIALEFHANTYCVKMLLNISGSDRSKPVYETVCSWSTLTSCRASVLSCHRNTTTTTHEQQPTNNNQNRVSQAARGHVVRLLLYLLDTSLSLISVLIRIQQVRYAIIVGRLQVQSRKDDSIQQTLSQIQRHTIMEQLISEFM
jgi:hypothetical protein